MKKSINILSFLLFTCFSLHAQTTLPGLARVGGKGIFVLCGDKISNESGPVTGYIIERKAGADKFFKEMITLKAVSTVNDFKSNLLSSTAMLPYNPDLSIFKIDTAWRKGKATGLISKLGPLGGSLPVLAGFKMIWLDREVSPGITYEYRVTAIGTKEISQSVPVTMGKRKGPGPIKFIAGNYEVPQKSMFIRYQATGIYKPSFLEVYRTEINKNEFLKVDALVTPMMFKDSTVFVIKDSTIQKFGIYRYYVKAWDALGNSAATPDTVQVSALDYVQMLTPQYIKAIPDSGANRINISWELQDASLIKMIRLFRSTNSVNGFIPIATISLDQRSYIDEAVMPATPYFYYFELTYKTSERSKKTTLFSGSVMSTELPGIPQGFTATQSPDGIVLSWNYYEISTGTFHIYRGKEGGKMQLLNTNIGAIDSVHNYEFTDTDSALVGGNFYKYAVQAISTSHVAGLFSDTASIYIAKKKSVKPLPPMQLAGNYTDEAVHLFWEDTKAANADISGYSLLRKSAGKTDTIYTGVNHFSDTSVQEGKTYTYTVLSNAYSGARSAASLPATLIVPILKSAAPSQLTAKKIAKGTLLKWQLPDDGKVLTYHVYRYIRGNEPTKIASLTKGMNTFTDVSATEASPYFYYVVAVNDNGIESDQSKEATVYR